MTFQKGNQVLIKFFPDIVYYERVGSLFHSFPVLFFCFHVGIPVGFSANDGPVLRKHRNSSPLRNFLRRVKFFLSSLISVFHPFRSSRSLSKKQKLRAHDLFVSVRHSINSKQELYDLHLDGVRLGAI